MTDSPADAIAILRIEIKYIEPLIWRRVAVRTSMNLEALHTVIQATMGWLDYHLWELVVEERKYGIPDPARPHVKNGATTQLATVPASGVTEFGYVYGQLGTSNRRRRSSYCRSGRKVFLLLGRQPQP
jgi:hypothetical protein